MELGLKAAKVFARRGLDDELESLQRNEGLVAQAREVAGEEEMVKLPGTAVIRDGYLVPSDAPGFGLEVTLEWLERAAS